MMLWSASINTVKFTSDVKIIRLQRKIANGEIILKINEQQTNIKSNVGTEGKKNQLNQKFLNNNSIPNKFKPFLEYKINKLNFNVKFQFQLEEFKRNKLQPIFFCIVGLNFGRIHYSLFSV